MASVGRMTAPTPYLHLPGTARDALTFYGEVFGCGVQLHTFEEFGRTNGPPDAVAHGYLVDGPVALFASDVTGDGPTLTNAELRVLRMLPSHMTFREIGERLHVSTNTVKTQALSVYRKLDVSCRSEAVDRGRLAGVIEG